MNSKLFLLLSLAVLFSACGKPATKSNSSQKIRITPEEMSLIIAAQNITCSDQDFCPEGIARMFAINFEDADNSTTCSAFLVAPDLVMTNTHCVHGGEKDLEKICSGIYFVFPSHGFNYNAQCSSILWSNRHQSNRHNYRNGDNDFALIRLDRNIPMTPMKIITRGLRPGATVYPLVVDQMGGFNARITKLECEVERIIDRFGVAKLSNCPVISGNSGAPVMDEDKNVIGIIFASSDNKVRSPNDEISFRKRAHSEGFAFTMDFVLTKMGHLL